MELAAYFPVVLQITIALLLAGVIIVVSHIFGQKTKSNPIKDSPYECGLLSEGTAHPRFSVKFYLVAMLFILFDIEVVFLVPWTVIYREFLQNNIPILCPILFFFLVLIVGFSYEVRKGALDWEK
ncbi:MAG: NADH-quinone oxidoreductase subunit A [Verrucomicrobiota bacterium]|nr:NADH-quinone oxidoreductase subunit A [Verrucomicrobiota bacterium]